MLPKIKNIIKKNENPYLFNFADICLIFPILTLIYKKNNIRFAFLLKK